MIDSMSQRPGRKDVGWRLDSLIRICLKDRMEWRNAQFGRGVHDAAERSTMAGIRRRGAPDMRSVEGTRDDQSKKQQYEDLKAQVLHEYLDTMRSVKVTTPAHRHHEVWDAGSSASGSLSKRDGSLVRRCGQGGRTGGSSPPLSVSPAPRLGTASVRP
jgi:hypothetical protein